MKDFQPKHTAAENVNPGGNKRMITEGEAETHISPEPEITQPDFTVSSSAEAQKRVQLEKQIRKLSVDSPQETAQVIKGWLSDR